MDREETVVNISGAFIEPEMNCFLKKAGKSMEIIIIMRKILIKYPQKPIFLKKRRVIR